MDDSRAGGYTYSDEPSQLYTIGKYWVHGFLYQILTTVVLIPTLFAMIFLIIVISFIGLIIGFGLLFMAIGWANKAISGYLWKIESRGAWTSLIGHGLALFIALLLVSFPVAYIQIMFYYSIVMYYVIAYGPTPIIQGYIAKSVAGYFSDDMTQKAFAVRSGQTPKGPLTTCPYCNAVFPYREIDITVEGTAPCRTCGAVIQDPRYRPGGPRRAQPSRGLDQDTSRDNDDSVWG
ncbi:MAG: hypothetical protein ACFFF4_09215 [Candidatus Thorarchaeota archaeon]